MKILLMLLVMTNSHSSTESTIYNALMGYETPNKIRNNINSQIKRKLGKVNTTILGSSYNILTKKQIEFKINNKYHFTIKSDEIKVYTQFNF